MKVLFVFLDGVGIGPADESLNPFLRAELPVLRTLLGGAVPTLDEPRVGGSDAVAFPLDATLGTPGYPQSGTGQTALLTGADAPALFGRHFGPWVPVALRPLVEDESLLRRAVDAGLSVAFANAYPRDWPARWGGRWLAAPPLAARGAGVLDRHEDALGRGDAVASEILNDGWRDSMGLAGLPTPTAAEAGANLARLAAAHDLTLFAHYSTDAAGHEGEMGDAVRAIERVDAFMGGVLDHVDADTLVLVASDHGNVEDVSQAHTTNPVLGMLIGAGAAGRVEAMGAITDVVAAVEGWLGVTRR